MVSIMYSWGIINFYNIVFASFWGLSAQVKETHQIIKEWVQTKQLISKKTLTGKQRRLS